MEDFSERKDSMADRRAELERKRQKLALLREEKARRKREKEALRNEPSSPVLVHLKREKDIIVETEKLLASLNVTTSVASLPSLSDSSLSDCSLNKPTVVQLPPPPKPKKVNLSLVNVHQTTIPPHEKVVYDKQTQTLQSSTEKETLSLDYYEWEDEFQVLTYDDSSISEDGESLSLQSTEGSLPHMAHPKLQKVIGLPNVNMVKPAQTAVDEKKLIEEKQKEESKKVKDLSEEEKMMLMRSESFQQFLDRTARIIERAISEDVDIFIDYTGVQEEADNDDRSGMSLSLNRCFFDDHWSKNRTVTSFDWSTIFPELLCTSYNQNDEAPHLPDGICLIWNMKFKKNTPEYVFHCQSPVTAACFAKYHPNLVIGGTYSGQIVLWDNRSNKRTPVQRSPLSAVAHTHPVYSICMVGSENAHNLVTVSTDGKCCTWSVDMLSAPQDTIELNQQKQSKTVAVTCMAFPKEEFNNFVVGGEDGIVYSACRHGSKSGIVETFESHQGPVTAVSTHRSRGPTEFPDLFLTSSFDWTVKLWSLKETQPLYSFEHNSDYVFDVSWSPVHPALFACVDGLGNFDLWNLNCDTELPTVGTVIEGSPALNRVSWTSSGQHVAVGDALGKVWLYDVGEQLANPKADEWTRFSETLEEFQNNQSYLSGEISSQSNLQTQVSPSVYLSASPMR